MSSKKRRSSTTPLTTSKPKKLKKEETENSKTITNVTPLDLPEYLKCPICKEMLINPEMFSCGHTICSICTESRPTSLCPVCKVPTYSHNRIPNYIVKEMLEQNYPKEQEKRKEQFEELKGLREKLQKYTKSTRHKKLMESFNEFLSKNVFFHFEAMVNHLTHMDLTPSPSREEIEYFLSLMLLRTCEVGTVGEHIVDKKGIEPMLDHMESKKSTLAQNRKWIPLLIPCITLHSTLPFSFYEKLSKLYKVDIGKELPLDEWRGRPARWIKDLELEIPLHFSFEMNYNSDGSEYDSEDYDSYSDF